MHYLDNSSTTQPSETAREALLRASLIWGNPSSTHKMGMEAKRLLEESRKTVARVIGGAPAPGDTLVFTATGTEANNISLLGCALSKKRDRANPGTIVISEGEHPSVENPAALLEREGFTLVRVPTRGGALDLDYLESALKTATSPVIYSCFMLVNNETGALYDVKAASSLVKRYFPDANTHCDAVQGFLKMKFTPRSLGVDTLTVSAHKINSYRGAAALYVSGNIIKRKNITSPMPGGGQESGLRSGTENLLSIAAFAAAAEDGCKNLAARAEKIKKLRAMLDEELDAKLIPLGVKPNLPENHVDAILNLSLPGIKSETMLNYLSVRDICVSAGSACSAHSHKKSAALAAFGVSPRDADCALRISLGDTNTEEDISALSVSLADGIRSLQRMK